MQVHAARMQCSELDEDVSASLDGQRGPLLAAAQATLLQPAVAAAALPAAASTLLAPSESQLKAARERLCQAATMLQVALHLTQALTMQQQGADTVPADRGCLARGLHAHGVEALCAHTGDCGDTMARLCELCMLAEGACQAPLVHLLWLVGHAVCAHV